MNTFHVLCFVAFAIAIVWAGEMPAIVQSCAKEFKLTPLEVETIQPPMSIPSDSKPVSENMKCFAKCTIDGSEVINMDGALDVEKLVAITSAKGKDEAKVRAMAEKCKSLFKKNSTCDEAFLAYKCSMAPI